MTVGNKIDFHHKLKTCSKLYESEKNRGRKIIFQVAPELITFPSNAITRGMLHPSISKRERRALPGVSMPAIHGDQKSPS